MDDQELERLLAGPECDRVEREGSPANASAIRHAICSFANDLPDHRSPGVLIVGVNDDGSCAGLSVTDELLLKLSSMKSDGNIVPFPSMEVRKAVLRGCEMALVIVHPADYPPVRYQGRICVRAGSSGQYATPEEERRLNEKRRGRDTPFELRPVAGASTGDLDLDLFTRVYLPAAVAPEVLAANDRPVEMQLESVRFVAEGRPTVLGMLTVGKDPAAWVPGAHAQFVHVDGTCLGDPIVDAEEIGGPLPELVRRLDDKLNASIRTAVDIVSGPTDVRSPDYPLAALRQLAYNGLLHRTYEGTNAPVHVYWFSDRVEVHSPGGPFGRVTKQNFGQPGAVDYRNRHLAEAMKNLGYVQRFGAGIPIARRECERNGNPPPEFVPGDSHVMALIRSRP